MEVPVPLPFKGIFSEAKSAEVNGLFAERLDDFETDGLSLTARPSAVVDDTSSEALQRFGFEFGDPTYIEVFPDRYEANGQTRSRFSIAEAMCAMISSNAVFVDGQNAPARWDGTTWSNPEFTVVTGIDPAEFDNIIAHHDRLYAWRSGDLDFYYGGVGSVTGAMTLFPLSRLGNITGKISMMVSLTIDAGHGPNDLLAIITTTGMVVVYEGLDPGDDLDWRLFGRIQMAPPVNRWCHAPYGTDHLVLTEAGLVSLIGSIRQSRQAFISAMAEPVRKELLEVIKANRDRQGWDLTVQPDGQRIILNTPLSATTFGQFVYRVESEAWTRWRVQARWWHSLISELNFTAADGKLGSLNDAGDEVITSIWHSSWFSFKRYSQFMSMIPTIRAKDAISITLRVLTNRDSTPTDLAEALQQFAVQPEIADTGRVTFDEFIQVDEAGASYQIRMEITGKRVELISILGMLE